MWPFKKIRINTRDREECEISFLGITVIQYGHKETNGIKETYLEILPKSFEHKTLDKIISFLPKGNTFDHVWIVRTEGLGEANLLNYMIGGLSQKWGAKKICYMSHRGVYKDMFRLYSDTPFYRIELSHADYAFYLKRRNVKYRGKNFHVFHCTIDESLSWLKRKQAGERSHAIESYKAFNGIDTFDDVKLQLNPTDIEKLKAQIGDLNLSKFVFIAPEAHGTQRIGEHLWLEFTNKLKNAGFDVYINTETGKSPYGKASFLSVKDAVYLASLAQGIVALRCGFTEVLASIRERNSLYALYPFFRGINASEFFNTYTLSRYPFYNKENTFEFEVTPKNTRDVFNKIFNQLIQKSHSV